FKGPLRCDFRGNPSHYRTKACGNFSVMPALVAGIHVLAKQQQVKTWMASEVGLARLPHIINNRKSDISDLR
ncbi:MAG: hypothetical protein WAN42_22025, partial [Pseudolabrys sp.]